MESTHAFYENLAQWSEILGGIAFVVVAFVLFRKLMLPMVQAAAVARNADLVNAERRREALRAEVAEARAELEAAMREGQSIRERGKADAQRERDRILADAVHEGTRIVQNADGELERARIAARDQLRIELIEAALNRARALARERIDEGVNARLVSKTVDELTGGAR
jgi:F-type H+-transporting ATPase subunit b